MTHKQRARRLGFWLGSTLIGLLWLALLIIPAAIGGYITAEQPASVITSR